MEGRQGGAGISNAAFPRAEALPQLCPSTTEGFGFVPCPAPELSDAAIPKQRHSQRNAAQKARNSAAQGWGLSQGHGFPIPSLHGNSSWAEQDSRPKVMEPGGDSDSRVKMFCSGQRWHLTVTSAASTNRNVLESSYLPQKTSSHTAVEDTMNACTENHTVFVTIKPKAPG